MDLINEFDVSVSIDEAWRVLTDVERIAPCLPGAQLEEIEGDEYRGVVKVKVGPITAQYKGVATFDELDEVAHRAVLTASGRDTRGQGNASATITATLEPADGGTHVTVTTDLTVTGKVAQFGRGVMADVSAKLLDQFVENLETTVLAGETVLAGDVGTDERLVESPAESPVVGDDDEAPASSDVSGNGSGSPTLRVIDQPEADPVDLLEAAGSPVMKRALPLLGVVVAVMVLLRLWRRRSRRTSP